MTVFIWTPRIGNLGSEKDQRVVKHYTKQLDKLKEGMLEPPHSSGIPYVHGPFTNWKPKPMRDVVEYCMRHDHEKPDFVQECVNEGTVRADVVAEDKME